MAVTGRYGLKGLVDDGFSATEREGFRRAMGRHAFAESCPCGACWRHRYLRDAPGRGPAATAVVYDDRPVLSCRECGCACPLSPALPEGGDRWECACCGWSGVVPLTDWDREQVRLMLVGRQEPALRRELGEHLPSCDYRMCREGLCTSQRVASTVAESESRGACCGCTCTGDEHEAAKRLLARYKVSKIYYSQTTTLPESFEGMCSGLANAVGRPLEPLPSAVKIAPTFSAVSEQDGTKVDGRLWPAVVGFATEMVEWRRDGMVVYDEAASFPHEFFDKIAAMPDILPYERTTDPTLALKFLAERASARRNKWPK